MENIKETFLHLKVDAKYNESNKTITLTSEIGEHRRVIEMRISDLEDKAILKAIPSHKLEKLIEMATKELQSRGEYK